MQNDSVRCLFQGDFDFKFPTRVPWLLPLPFQVVLRQRIGVLQGKGPTGLTNMVPFDSVSEIRRYNRGDPRENSFKTEGRITACKKIEFILGKNPSTRGDLIEAYVYGRFIDSSYFCPNGYPWESLSCPKKLVYLSWRFYFTLN